METFIAKYKIKKGHLNTIKKWAAYLKKNKSEVLMSLRCEGVNLETAFIDKQMDGYYLIYFMRCESIKKVFTDLYKSKSKIDIYHKKTLSKSLEEPLCLEKMIDFSL